MHLYLAQIIAINISSLPETVKKEKQEKKKKQNNTEINE
jgi:hypothetical protein